MMIKSRLNYLALPIFLLSTVPAMAIEYPAGSPQICGGMEIAAVYLQPIEMEPTGMMLAVSASDIHLEADIHATQDNKNGFQEGSWIPALVIEYELTKTGGKSQSGEFHAMVASDGPHYGANIKMQGAGNYVLTYIIKPPSANPAAMFGRHVDKETGVGEWFQPCTLKYEFVYAGIGKKGGY